MLRFAPLVAVFVLAGPVVAGLAGTIGPALGYMPALGFDTLDSAPLRQLIGTPGLRIMCALSLFTGLAATALSLLITTLFTAGWQGTRAFAALRRVLSPLLAVPHAAAAFGLAFLIAPSGWIARLVSPGLTGWERPPDALIVNDALGLTLLGGLVVKEVPFLFLVTLAALGQADAERGRRLAASLGYGRVRGWLLTVFPGVYRQIRLPVLATLAFSASVVDMAIILGPTTPPTLAVRIVEWTSDPDLALRRVAACGALLQFGLVLALMAVWLAGERIAMWIGRNMIAGGRRGRGLGGRLLVMAGPVLAGLSAAVIGLGLVVLALWSIAGPWRFPDAWPSSATLGHWMRAGPGALAATETTLWLGIVSAGLALVLAVAVLENEFRQHARRRLAASHDFHAASTGTGSPRIREALAEGWGRGAMVLIYLPLLVPQISLLFGLDTLFLTLGISATFGAVLLAHLTFVAPYVFLSLGHPWRAFDARYVTVARTLGRSATAALWRVRLPMLARPVLAALALGFAVSTAQYLPTLLVGGGRLTTLTTESVALASGGNRRLIGVWALLQLALPTLVFAAALAIPALVYRNRRGLGA